MGKVKCFAKTFKIPTEDELREWSEDKYQETRKKMFPRSNVGCEEVALEKLMEFQEARANALGINRLLPEIAPDVPEIAPDVPEIAPNVAINTGKSPSRHSSRYKKFRTRNNLEFKRDILDRFGNSLYDAGNSIMNVSKGTINSLHGIGKLGVHGYRTGTKTIGKLKNCTVRCDSIEDCCEENEIKQLIKDLTAIDKRIIREEQDKFMDRVQDAITFAETLDESERKDFLDETEEKLRKELHANLQEAMETITGIYDPFENVVLSK